VARFAAHLREQTIATSKASHFIPCGVWEAVYMFTCWTGPGAGPKTGGEKSEESNQNRVHRGCNHHLTNDGNLCIFKSVGVFGMRSPPPPDLARDSPAPPLPARLRFHSDPTSYVSGGDTTCSGTAPRASRTASPSDHWRETHARSALSGQTSASVFSLLLVLLSWIYFNTKLALCLERGSSDAYFSDRSEFSVCAGDRIDVSTALSRRILWLD
jgi:hypothetical protein